jgi:alpha-beta hydrolase superfamily lysophospholipase
MCRLAAAVNRTGIVSYVEKIEDYTDDVDLAVNLGVAPSRLPVLLPGHSAGGWPPQSIRSIIRSCLKGFVCVSFAFQTPAPDFALAVLKGLSHIAPHAHVLKLKNEAFSRDPEVVARMNADPLIENEVQPTQTIAALVRADERLKREFSKFMLPILIIHGTEDKVTKPSASSSTTQPAPRTRH